MSLALNCHYQFWKNCANCSRIFIADSGLIFGSRKYTTTSSFLRCLWFHTSTKKKCLAQTLFVVLSVICNAKFDKKWKTNKKGKMILLIPFRVIYNKRILKSNLSRGTTALNQIKVVVSYATFLWLVSPEKTNLLHQLIPFRDIAE